MRKKLGKTIITLLVMISLFGTQLLLPLQANAGNQFLNYDNPNKNGNNPYKLSVSAITPQMLTSVVSCTGIENKIAAKLVELNDVISKELDKLTKKAKKALQDLVTTRAKRIAKEKAAEAVKRAAQEALAAAAATAGAVPAVGAGIATGLQTAADVIGDQPPPTTTKVEQTPEERKKADKAAQEKRDEDAKKERLERTKTCLNGVAVALARQQLTSMTKYTMNWINSGFNGNPLYVTNVSSFMDSIAQNVIEREVGWFKNPASLDDHPFGRATAKELINVYKNQNDVLSSTISDLNKYIPGTSTPNDATQDFTEDFAAGGWDGWMAITQRPQNNPLGYQIKIGQDIGSKILKKNNETTTEISRGGGVLDQKRCVLWQKYDGEGEPQYDADGNPITATTGQAPDVCIKDEVITPGSIIKTKVDTYVNTPEKQLELVKTMDDALNSLFAALLSKFENQGLAGLRSSVNNYTGTGGGAFGVNQIFDNNGNPISGGAGTVTGGGYSGNGYFDITKDLGNIYTPESLKGTLKIATPGVLQLQYDYLDLLDNSKTILAKVMPALGKLDYCIPGPNPDWKNLSQDAISSYLDTMSTEANPPIDPGSLDQMITDYGTHVSDTYGSSSSMQDSSSSGYLQMANAGLNITKDMTSYNDTITEAQADYQSTKTELTSNIAKLNTIKGKVNAIIVAAQRRRATRRAQAGLSAIKPICLSVEKVTYLDNGVLK